MFSTKYGAGCAQSSDYMITKVAYRNAIGYACGWSYSAWRSNRQEAPPGIEPGTLVFQTSDLPLAQGATPETPLTSGVSLYGRQRSRASRSLSTQARILPTRMGKWGLGWTMISPGGYIVDGTRLERSPVLADGKQEWGGEIKKRRRRMDTSLVIHWGSLRRDGLIKHHAWNPGPKAPYSITEERRTLSSSPPASWRSSTPRLLDRYPADPGDQLPPRQVPVPRHFRWPFSSTLSVCFSMNNATSDSIAWASICCAPDVLFLPVPIQALVPRSP